MIGQPPPPVVPTSSVSEEHLIGRRVQQKLNKIVKAAKKEENLSPEFQNLVHAEMKEDNKECSRNLHTAVTALDKAKEAQLEMENARQQLWSQWRIFLQQSVIKWKEYTAQFQSGRTSFPGTGFGITDDTEESTKKIGPRKEANGCRRQGWHLHSVLRRGDRRHGQQGGNRTCQGRECTENPRGTPPSCHELGNPVRITGAQSQTPKKGRRRGWCWWGESITKLAAFCAGRRCVTSTYTRQWPLETSIDVRANAMQWGHSILMEENYISPWQAIENASDLALEVGVPSTMIVDCFSLPNQGNQTDKTVRFQDEVQVITEDDGIEEFLLHTVSPYEDSFVLSTTTFPRGMTIGDTGSSASGDQGQQPSSGSAPAYHFLDRNLPHEIPNYIHHLQHLWRERNLRVPDDDYHRLRTWYIHHQHVQQCKRPRIVELEGDGTRWHQEILSAWRDQLYNQEVLNIAVVYPDIRAPQDRRALPHADLLLIQGGLERNGGSPQYILQIQQELTCTLGRCHIQDISVAWNFLLE